MSYEPTDCDLGLCDHPDHRHPEWGASGGEPPGTFPEPKMRKCVYGEHEVQARCPQLNGRDACEPEPETAFAGAGTIDFGGVEDSDFASLLEMEPQPAGGIDSQTRDQLRRQQAEQALNSAASRIKELEGVLVAVRARLAELYWPSQRAREIQGDLIGLINETLDPCKPWCVLEPGHGGACEPIEEERE